MTTNRPVFLSVDWSQLESWLTAWHAEDDVMMDELKAQLNGGIKIHARNAAMFYGIDPADAKTTMVNLKGRPKPAYDGGKRVSHLWNYGGKAKMIANTLWIDLKLAQEMEAKLAAKYVKTAQWRKELTDMVFGVGEFACVRCGRKDLVGGACSTCSRPRLRVQMRWSAWAQAPQRMNTTVFGRRRLYPGKRSESANPLASQDPQSCGGSMWWRTLMRLHGIEVEDGKLKRWPRPGWWMLPEFPAHGVCVDPTAFLGQSEGITSGTYDSFLVETVESRMGVVADWLTWTMEQTWSQLKGLSIPCEMKWGLNYGDRVEKIEDDGTVTIVNPDGLRDFPRVEFEGAFERMS